MFFITLQMHGHGQRIGDAELNELVMTVIAVAIEFGFIFFCFLNAIYMSIAIILAMNLDDVSHHVNILQLLCFIP
jgi:hypothetical protein